VVLLALCLSGCGGEKPPQPVIELSVAAGPVVNPNAEGRPTPVAVRLFYLTSPAKFERADVFALTEREKATLGDDAMGSEELVVGAGESEVLTKNPKPGVRFLGTAVLFRDIDAAKWRSVQPIAPSGPTRLRLEIGPTDSRLTVAK